MKKKYLLSYVHADGDGVPLAMAVIVELDDQEAYALRSMIADHDPDITTDAALEDLEEPKNYSQVLEWIEEHGGL